jgi:hypothetical protein
MKTVEPDIYTSEEKVEEYCARVSEQLMKANIPDVLASLETFEAYCARVTGDLGRQWDERAAFLRRSKDRLQSLQRVARAVQDARVEEELSIQLSAAAAALRRLEEVAPDLSPERAEAA